MDDPTPVDVATTKLELRRAMRAIRRALPDRTERSMRLWEHVWSLAEVRHAARVMAFDSVPGEPVTAPFVEQLRAHGIVVVVPEDDPVPESVDVVLVPGTAFTGDGRRLGQGGGWYDRFLPQTRDDCLAIGVGFGPQLLDDLPTEAHDVRLDVVVTDEGITGPDRDLTES